MPKPSRRSSSPLKLALRIEEVTMQTYEATMRVVHAEIWTVEAKDEAEARKKISELSPHVEMDEDGGEIVDWECYQIKPVAE
jgi:hypothetical protein